MIDTEQLRLEGKAAFHVHGSLVAALAIEAADEIDRLRAALKEAIWTIDEADMPISGLRKLEEALEK